MKREDIQLKHRQDIAAARGEYEEKVGELRIQVLQAVERAKKCETMVCVLDNCSLLFWALLSVSKVQVIIGVAWVKNLVGPKHSIEKGP